MGLFNFFGENEHRVFNYKPIYYDPEEKTFSEKEEKDGRKLELSRGIRWIDNDMVNLMSNVFSAVFALGMGMLVLK